ncbi:MAG: hypothetical protein E6H67_16270 [Betaproteobacteria bacterium]|nr:MAG: hypothetical protein E6H67_16270 [Betaproteobacteria bacterium]
MQADLRKHDAALEPGSELALDAQRCEFMLAGSAGGEKYSPSDRFLKVDHMLIFRHGLSGSRLIVVASMPVSM